jgi:hypothetical protein
VHLKARNWIQLPIALLFTTLCSAQTQPVHTTIDLSKPALRYRNIFMARLWSRGKHPKRSHRSRGKSPPVPAWRRRGPRRYWAPIGGDEFVTMDKNQPYTGEQTPLVKLDNKEPHGFQQSGLAVRKGGPHSGRVILAGSPSATIKVSLVLGDAGSDGSVLRRPCRYQSKSTCNRESKNGRAQRCRVTQSEPTISTHDSRVSQDFSST